MKKTFLIIIISVLFISGCDNQNQTITDNQEVRIVALEKEIENMQDTYDIEKQSEDLFAKKKKCADYKDEIMEDIMTPNLVYKESDPELVEIFYSPKRNSCLYVFDYYKSPDCLTVDIETWLKIDCQSKERQIVDFLTKETVYSSKTWEKCYERLAEKENADFSICKDTNEKVEELKN